MEAITPVALLSLVVFTIVSLVRYLRGKDWNGAVTVAAVWVAGFIACWLFAESAIGESLVIPGFALPLGAMGIPDLVLVGLAVGSAAVGVNEFRGALDRTTTTAKPKLLTGNTVMVDATPRIDPPPPPQ